MKFILSLLISLSVFVSSAALSTPIRLDFEGIVSNPPPTFLVPDSISDKVKRGDVVRGFYEFDMGGPDLISDTNRGLYRQDSGAFRFHIQAGDVSVESVSGITSANAYLYDDYLGGRAGFVYDQFNILSSGSSVVSGTNTVPGFINFIVLSTTNLDLISSDSMNLFDVDFGSADIYGLIGDFYRDGFRIPFQVSSVRLTNLDQVAVSAPAMVTMFTLFFCLVSLRRRQRENLSKTPRLLGWGRHGWCYPCGEGSSQVDRLRIG